MLTYYVEDILPHNGTANSSDTSPVTRINGLDVEYFLNELSPFRDNAQFHDADARYNALFTKQVARAQGSDSPAFSTASHYVGDSTTLEFANGTTRSYHNVATFGVDFSGVEDGKSFFQKFCTGSPAPEAESPADSTLAGAETDTSIYPPALYSETFGSTNISAYHFNGMIEDINGTSSDTMVLSVPSFDLGNDGMVTFQRLVSDVLE